MAAYERVWDDSRVVAVTPFILNYTEPPFEEFSWKKKDGSFYSFYEKVSQTQKVKGQPTQEVKGKVIGAFVNPFLIADSLFKGVILARNLGQSIWVSPEISVMDESKAFEIATENFGELEPSKVKLIYFSSQAPDSAGKFNIPLVLRYKEKAVSETFPLEMVVVKTAEVKKLGLFAKIQVWFRDLLGL